MAENLNPPNLFNPMALWTDLGLRALEMTLSSSQNMSDRVDRLARAGASLEATEHVDAASAASSDPSASVANSGLAVAGQMQRATFELMTQAWQQWMNTLVALSSMGAGRGFGETAARQNPWLNAMREGLQAGSASATPFTRELFSSPSHKQRSGERESQTEATEHGHARAEPKRRSRGGRAKPKTRSRSS